MKKQMQPIEAWRDFYEYFNGSESFKKLDDKDKARIREANAAAKGQRRYPLGINWVKDILTTYAPERYEFTEAVTINEDG